MVLPTHGHLVLADGLLKLYLFLFEHENAFLEVVVLDHEVGSGVILLETILWGLCVSASLSYSSLLALPGDGRSNEDVL